ncbi:hypothetical protein H0H92_005101 [Tricholoma furcatifolium]|nr:hypothetical protein H0H92_005101 [Tricholoma furcatifolium]
MGGNAFAALLGSGAFPRMPPAVYHAMKTRLLSKISALYEHVAVPFEAPEKTSYGDVDFVVAFPKVEAPGSQVNIPHEVVQKTLEARHANVMDGNHTSNFAVPVAPGEWRELGYDAEEDEARKLADNGDIFYQVDINVCADKAEFDRIVFFHAYGDLGMIMSLLARSAGLSLGERGLKLPNVPHPPLELSQSFDDILKFMGWSMDTWKAGFHTKREVFEWAASTKFFNPAVFKTGESFTKVSKMADRKMYGEFLQWVEGRTLECSQARRKHSEDERQASQNLALVYFKKNDEFDTMNHEREQKIALKKVFSGSRVRDWAELNENWKAVKMIMDAMRVRYNGEGGILELYDAEGEEGVKRAVMDEKARLPTRGLTSQRENVADELSEALDSKVMLE